MAQTLWANEAFVFKSPVTGQDVFELVNNSQEGDHKSAPGIYEINKKTGKVRLITQGEIMGLNRGFNGVLASSVVSSEGHETYDVAVILNGQLTLLNRNSSVKKPNSILTIGANSSVQVVDVLQRMSVTIPPIYSLDEITVYADTNQIYTADRNLAQVFLVSLKSLNTFGTGFTLAFALEKPTAKGDVPKLVNDKVYVLGYEYLKENQLKQLIANSSIKGEYQLYSPSIINMIAARMEARKDQPLVTRWLKQLNQFISTLTQGNRKIEKKVEERLGVPTFSLVSESINLETLLADVIMAKPFALMQTYNPTTSQWSVILQEPTEDVVKYMANKAKRKTESNIAVQANNPNVAIQGEVDLDKNGKDYKIYLSENSFQTSGGSQNSSYLLSASGKTLALLMSELTDRYIKGVIPDEHLVLSECKKLNFIHAIGKSDDKNLRYHYLIASLETNTRKKVTKVFIFEEKGGELAFITASDLMNSYMTELELSSRLTYSVKNNKGENRVVFDNVTPVKGANYYRRKEVTERTVPLFNLRSLVTSGEDTQYYAKDEENVAIIPDKVYYKKYNPTGALEVKTGIYLASGETGETRSMDLVATGELFFKRKGRGNKNVLEQVDINFDRMSDYHSFPPMGVAIFPYNPNVGKQLSKKSFRLALAVWARSLGYRTSLIHMSLDLPFETVQAIKIIHGKRLKQEYISLLMFMDGAVQGIYAWNFKITLDISQASKKILLSQADGGWISKEYVTPQTLKQRLKTDTSGEYYWIHDVETDTEAARFAVRSLLNPSKLIYPNREGNRIKLRMNEIYEEGVIGVGTTGGQWLTIGKQDIYSNSKWFEEEWKKHEKKVEHFAKKSRKYTPNIFPLFRKFLENFADRSKRAETKKRQVLIVEDRMKKEMLTQMYLHALAGSGKFSLDPKVGKDFDFHIYDE
ncbi:MAG: hypothetical protein KDD40_02325, partial [Bdellovibrionales bacterium]|nr:hypothetical protein [Bdellovibrionales bacterium]